MKVLFLFLSLTIFASVSAKICWKNCSNDGKYLKSIDIEGCRRRWGSANQGRQRFRCNGMEGPPCIVKRGDTVHLQIDFDPDFAIKDLTQNAYWMTTFPIPWVGLDKAACKYLDQNCQKNEVRDAAGNIQPQSFRYPIEIQNFYPTGSYNLKWDFVAEKQDGNKEEIACFNFAIKIV